MCNATILSSDNYICHVYILDRFSFIIFLKRRDGFRLNDYLHGIFNRFVHNINIELLSSVHNGRFLYYEASKKPTRLCITYTFEIKLGRQAELNGLYTAHPPIRSQKHNCETCCPSIINIELAYNLKLFYNQSDSYKKKKCLCDF